MKKKTLSMAVAAVLALGMLSSSCIGSFALTSKLMNWNNQIGNKFLNEVVFFAFWVLPVYEVTAMADVLVLNTIEFWSGTNPIACNSTTVVDGNTGRYIVERTAEGYTITSESNPADVVTLNYNTDDQSWSIATPDSEPLTFMTMIDDSHVGLLTPSGSFAPIELNADATASYFAAAGLPLPLIASR